MKIKSMLSTLVCAMGLYTCGIAQSTYGLDYLVPWTVKCTTTECYFHLSDAFKQTLSVSPTPKTQYFYLHLTDCVIEADLSPSSLVCGYTGPHGSLVIESKAGRLWQPDGSGWTSTPLDPTPRCMYDQTGIPCAAYWIY